MMLQNKIKLSGMDYKRNQWQHPAKMKRKQPVIIFQGFVLTVVMDTMTTKIKNVVSDPLGRWTNVFFVAIKGTMSVYTVYRPNKANLNTAGGDTMWM